MKEFCVDLEIAKELKENGFPQNTFFWYNKDGYFKSRFTNNLFRKGSYSVPTSDELLKELPPFIDIETYTPIKCLILSISKNDIGYMVTYGSYNVINQEKLTNGLAKMWLLLKNKDINKNLSMKGE